jgi:hypothetical protein
MTNDLKRQFEQLVADPPSPNGVPSEAVFARVRSVRRRRTAGVATLAAAAVVAVAVAAGNFADVNSRPPVTGTPSAPTTVVTGPPTTSPATSAAPTKTPEATKTGTAPATTAGPTEGSSPGKGTTTGKETTTGTRTTTAPPAKPPIDVDVKLHPTINGRTVSMDITVSGTVIRPMTLEGKPMSSDTSFLNLSGGTNFIWGDRNSRSDGGSDGQTVTCKSTIRTTGRETYSIESHTYPKPGTYTFRYTVMYCGTDGVFQAAKTAKLVIK